MKKAVLNVTMPVTKSFSRAMKPLARAYSKNLFDPKGLSHLKIPQGLTQEQFAKVTQLIKDNEKIKKIGGQVFIQGSRAKGTATIVSDIDIGIRVDQQTFDLLIKECFNGAQNTRLNTMNWAIATGKIQRGELKLSRLGKEIATILGLSKVDISVVKVNGRFDIGPFINL